MISIQLSKQLDGPDGKMVLQVDATIQKGKFVTIFGPSGAGKTSILRMLAGLLKPDSGRITVGESVWFDNEKKIHIRPQLRSIGMVFQDYSLFPNMTVKENLEFALEKGQAKAIVADLLELTELGQLAGKRPLQLSGGQKQRVALARALVRKPQLLLLDEPLSALDAEMQDKLQDYILQVHREFGLTTILISHDLIEVVKMSQRVLVLKQGRIAQDGKPAEVLPLDRLRSFFAKGLI